MNTPAKIFISYAHKDESFKDKLIKHLTTLKEMGIADEWNDRELSPGSLLYEEIDDNLKDSEVFLLLISSDYISSYSCYKNEFPKIFNKWQDGTALIIPIIVRTTEWESLPIGNFLALPKDGKAIIKWKHQDDAFVNIIRGLKRLIEVEQKKTIKEQFKETPEEIAKCGEKLSLSIHKMITQNISIITPNTRFGMLFIDIDGLTKINHKYSIEIGNKVLLHTEKALNNWKKGQSLVSEVVRIYGDQFAIIFIYNGSTIKLELTTAAESILSTIKNYYYWKEIRPDFYVTVSIGASYHSFHKEDYEILSQNNRDNLHIEFYINKYFFDDFMTHIVNLCERVKREKGLNNYLISPLAELYRFTHSRYINQFTPPKIVQLNVWKTAYKNMWLERIS